MAQEIKLLKAAMAGDTAAFEQIVAKYQSLVCAITFSGTGRVDISEDLAQETFLSVWKNLRQLKDTAGFRAWLCTIARNSVHNYYRKKRPVPLDSAAKAELTDQTPDPSQNLIAQEEHLMLEKAIMNIPDQYRQPLVMFYRQNQSIRQVAQALELNESTVQTRLHRARQMLRDQMAERLEQTLQQTAPTKAFTKAVMVAVGATAVGLAAGTATAANAAGTSTATTLTSMLTATTAKIITAMAVAAIVVGVVAVNMQNESSEFIVDTQIVNKVETKKAVPEITTISQEKKKAENLVTAMLADNSSKDRIERTLTTTSEVSISEPINEAQVFNIPSQESIVAVEDANMITYRGVVKDEQGNPIEGVVITREWIDAKLELKKDILEVRTDSQGIFKFGPVKRLDKTDSIMSPHNLILDHPDYSIGWWNIYKDTELDNPNIKLFRPSSVSGFVLDVNGNEVEGALVQVYFQIKHQTGNRSYDYDYYNRDELHNRAVRTDSDGWFIFDRIPYHAKLDISAAHQEYGKYSTDVESDNSDDHPVDAGDNDLQLTLNTGGFIKGCLIKDGMPYQKSDIFVYIQGREGLSPRGRVICRNTDANGQFETNGLYAGTYYVAAMSDHFHKEGLACESLTDVIVNDSGPTEVELQVSSGLIVNIIVVDEETGEVVPNKGISVKSSDGVRLISRGSETNAEGHAVLRLKEGEYSISANGWKEGRFCEFSKEIVVNSEIQNQIIEIGIRTKPFIYGWLTDKNGKSVSGEVILDGKVTESDEDGLFEIPEPWYSPGDQLIGYAFDKKKSLGRIFFWNPEEPNDLEIIVEPLVTIKGRIVNQEGIGVDDIKPSIDLIGKSSSWSAKNDLWHLSVDSEGYFQFDGVPTGVEMKVFVEKPGYQGRVELGLVEPGQIVDAGDVLLKRLYGFKDDKIDWTGALSGRVTDENNQPVVGLKIDTSVGMDRFQDITDWNGRYTLKGLPKEKKLYVGGYKEGYGHCYSNVVVDGNDFDLQIFPQGWELLDKPAPGLYVEKWLNTEPKTLDQYQGKVLLLQIGVLLPNYRDQYRKIEKVYNKYTDKGLEVIAIHQRLHIDWAGEVTEKGIDDYIKKYNVPFAFCIDDEANKVRHITKERTGNGAMYSLYDVKATPALYLIDKQGILRVSPKDKDLEDWIKALLSE